MEDILESLRSNAKYDGNKLRGWDYRVNTSDQSVVHQGYITGNAGISHFLFELRNHGFQSDELLNQTIEQITTSYKISNGGVYWPRFVNIQSLGWTSNRYGIAGIMKYLSILHNHNYLDASDLVSKGFKWLLSQKVNNQTYPMSPGGYTTTGFDYGAGGIIQSLIDVYSVFKNSSYLEEAMTLGDSIINLGNWKGEKFNVPWTPFGNDTDFEDKSYLSISCGLAGLIDSFNRLYKFTNDEKYQNISIGLANTIVSKDLGGYWDLNAVDYISQTSNSKGLLGYRVGASGIAINLLNLSDLTGDKSYQIVANKVLSIIIENVQSNGIIQSSLELSNRYYTGYSKGYAGIADYLIQIYEETENSFYLETAISMANHLLSLYHLHNGIVPVDEFESREGYSYNLEDGMAGIGMVMLHLLDNGVTILKTQSDAVYPAFSPIESDLFRIALLGIAFLVAVIHLIYRRTNRL